MNDNQTSWWPLFVSCVVAAVLMVGVARPVVGFPTLEGSRWPLGEVSRPSHATIALAPGVGNQIHRLMTRAEHSLRRLGGTAGRVGFLWLWVLLSALVFLIVTAVASAFDLRMLDFSQQTMEETSRYLGYGIRLFFELVLDRHTPWRARSVLVAALIYWLLPADIIRDASIFPGFIDDLVVAVIAAKGFMYFCPDSLVDSHAASVEARA